MIIDGLALWGEQGLSQEQVMARIRAVPELLASLIDVLPYAIAAIGPTRDRWPHDSVILRAEAAIAAATANTQPVHTSALVWAPAGPFCGIDIPAFLRKYDGEETSA